MIFVEQKHRLAFLSYGVPFRFLPDGCTLAHLHTSVGFFLSEAFVEKIIVVMVQVLSFTESLGSAALVWICMLAKKLLATYCLRQHWSHRPSSSHFIKILVQTVFLEGQEIASVLYLSSSYCWLLYS